MIYSAYKFYTYKRNIMSIGKAKRKCNPQLKSVFDDERHVLPGVGAYNVLHSQFSANRGRSFTRANRSVTQSTTVKAAEESCFLLKPGPASYSVDLRRTEKNMSFTHSKRFLSSNNRIPGPGSYKSQECAKQKVKAGIICRSARKTVQLRESIPGPCDYSPPDILLYKKKEPFPLFAKAKRNLEAENAEEIASRESFRLGFLGSNEAGTSKNRGQIERTRQGRKLEKQAKIVQRDQVPSLPHDF